MDLDWYHSFFDETVCYDIYTSICQNVYMDQSDSFEIAQPVSLENLSYTSINLELTSCGVPDAFF